MKNILINALFMVAVVVATYTTAISFFEIEWAPIAIYSIVFSIFLVRQSAFLVGCISVFLQLGAIWLYYEWIEKNIDDSVFKEQFLDALRCLIPLAIFVVIHQLVMLDSGGGSTQTAKAQPQRTKAQPQRTKAQPQRTTSRRETASRPNNRPIEVGFFVQNDGFFQSWVGRVVKIEGNSYLVRITFVTAKYKRRFPVGNELWMSRNEFKEPTGKSAAAVAQGAFRK